MIEAPILVVLLFGLGVLSICGMVIFAASMRVMMPPQATDISRYEARNREYGRPARGIDLDQLYQNANQHALSRPSTDTKDKP
jgi:hypothetical protein